MQHALEEDELKLLRTCSVFPQRIEMQGPMYDRAKSLSDVGMVALVELPHNEVMLHITQLGQTVVKELTQATANVDAVSGVPLAIDKQVDLMDKLTPRFQEICAEFDLIALTAIVEPRREDLGFLVAFAGEQNDTDDTKSKSVALMAQVVAEYAHKVAASIADDDEPKEHPSSSPSSRHDH
jgi:hypothetical protein